MSAEEAARKDSLFAAASRYLGDVDWACFVPGRVELLGKHTDYAGGRSLLAATEQGFCFLARDRADSDVCLTDAATGSRITLSLGGGAGDQAGWGVYPHAVVRRLARDFGIERGVELAFASDLPAAAGLSSSSALCIGVFLALAAANRLAALAAFRAMAPDQPALAGYLGAVENGRPFGPSAGLAGVGTLGGSQDQTAILCSIPDEVVQFSFDPVRFERRIPFPAGHCLVIGASGVMAEKSRGAQEAYNTAARAAAEILRRWREATGRDDPSLGGALAGAPDARGRFAAILADAPVALRERFEQFVVESEELVPKAADALARGDLGELGMLVDRSHAGAERGLGNQIPETMQLQRSARRLGAVAASAFGAGFGGSVWAMVAAGRTEAFVRDWSAGYCEAFPQHGGSARFFTTQPGPTAVELAGL